MLGFIFGFNARLRRLPFFLLGIVLAVVMTALCFVVAWYVFQNTPRGTTPPVGALVGPALFIAPLFLFATFTLYCMRIRDIGWDPVYVLSGWLFLVAMDKIAAVKLPALSVGVGHHGTVFGGVVNLVFVCVLTFWPSGETLWSPPIDDGPTRGLRNVQPVLSPVSAPAMRGGATTVGFGRRGQ